jgi:hypothetical protein
MGQNVLRDFFREKSLKAKPSNVDWGARRDAWIAAVKDLYHRIEAEYLEGTKGEVEILYQEKAVRENLAGDYTIPELILRVGQEEVIFSPKGTNIFGAKGRIDIRGDRGEATIMWMGDRWSIVASRVPTLRLVDLNAESLAEALYRIMRP